MSPQWEPEDDRYDCGYQPAVWPLILLLIGTVALSLVAIGAVTL